MRQAQKDTDSLSTVCVTNSKSCCLSSTFYVSLKFVISLGTFYHWFKSCCLSACHLCENDFKNAVSQSNDGKDDCRRGRQQIIYSTPFHSVGDTWPSWSLSRSDQPFPISSLLKTPDIPSNILTWIQSRSRQTEHSIAK